jgi:DGQHR domain-containing protein
MGIGNFATLPATRGLQFGREIFTSMLLFKDLSKFLTVFADVQRDMNPRKVAQIKTYILSGLSDTEMLRFFSSITVTCRDHIFFDETSQRVAINTKESKLSINDGQHRFGGIMATIDFLKEKYEVTSDQHRKDGLKQKIDMLENMSMPLVIFNQISEKAEKQLFHDVNNLASRPSRSATIRLAQTDLVAQLSRKLANENKFLQNYGVEYDKGMIGDNNPNFILLTTIYKCVQDMYRESNQNGLTRIQLSEENVEDAFIYLMDTIDDICRALPYDITNKQVYLGHRNFVFKGIFRFIKMHRRNSTPEPLIFQAIKNVDWTKNFEYWKDYGARMGANNTIVFPHSEKGHVRINDALEDELSKIKGESK